VLFFLLKRDCVAIKLFNFKDIIILEGGKLRNKL